MPELNDDMYSEDSANVGEIVRNLAGLTLTYSALGVVRKGPKEGYYAPYTKGLGLGDIGESFGWWKKATGYKIARGVENQELRNMFTKSSLMNYSKVYDVASAKFGKSLAQEAASKVFLSRAAGFVLGPLTWGIVAKDVLWGAAGLYKGVSATVSKYRGLELGGYFNDTRGAYTSRQRSLQAITASQLQARSAIGNEAFLCHR